MLSGGGGGVLIQDPSFQKKCWEGLGGNDGSIQLRGPMQCLHLQSVEDKAQVPRTLPGPLVGQYQMDSPFFHTGRNTSLAVPASLLLSPSPKGLKRRKRVPLKVSLQDRGGIGG